MKNLTDKRISYPARFKRSLTWKPKKFLFYQETVNKKGLVFFSLFITEGQIEYLAVVVYKVNI